MVLPFASLSPDLTIPAAASPVADCVLCWYAAHPEAVPPDHIDGYCISHLIWTATRRQVMPRSQAEAEVRWQRYLAGGEP